MDNTKGSFGNHTLKSKPRLRVKPWFIAGGAVLIGLVVLMAIGVIYVGLKKPGERAVTYASVCTSDEVIQKLNAYLAAITDNGERPKATIAIDYIKALPNYGTDATCVEALARFYYINRSADNFGAQIKELEKLEKQGLYPSNRFEGLSSLTSKAIDFESLTGRSL